METEAIRLATVPVPKQRANWIGAPEFYHLNLLCRSVWEAFDDLGGGIYLVGSALTRRDHRDVDIRAIIDDDKYAAMFPASAGLSNPQNDARWSLVCASISEWLSTRSGLKIDFQIQARTEANKDKGPRCAVGIFIGKPQTGIVE